MATTTFARLDKIMPDTETEWRDIAAQAHRSRNLPGDEAAAKTHELHIWEIRNALIGGTSKEIRFCPKCLARGIKYMLLFMGGIDQCGTCGWPSSGV